MRCPKCTSNETRVIDSRSPTSGANIRRRRECTSCGHRFSTLEQLLTEDAHVHKSDGTLEPLDTSKLVHSLGKAFGKRPHNREQIRILVQETMDRLKGEFDNEIPSRAIADAIMTRLRSIDWIAYVRYASKYRKFKEADNYPSTPNNPTMT